MTKKELIGIVVAIVIGFLMDRYIIENTSTSIILPKKLNECKEIHKIDDMNNYPKDILQESPRRFLLYPLNFSL